MQVAYNKNNGRVFRIVFAGQHYPASASLSAWTLVDVPDVGNGKLLAALQARPDQFIYDVANTKFVEGTTDWPISFASGVAKAALCSRNATAMKAAANAATSVPALRAIVAELTDVVDELQRILGE